MTSLPSGLRLILHWQPVARLAPECWDAFNSDDESSGHIAIPTAHIAIPTVSHLRLCNYCRGYGLNNTWECWPMLTNLLDWSNLDIASRQMAPRMPQKTIHMCSFDTVSVALVCESQMQPTSMSDRTEHCHCSTASPQTDARELFQDLCQSHITSISQFLNQPQCNRLAKFLTWIRMMRMNKA